MMKNFESYGADTETMEKNLKRNSPLHLIDTHYNQVVNRGISSLWSPFKCCFMIALVTAAFMYVLLYGNMELKLIQ